jgi:glycogen operon protein
MDTERERRSLIQLLRGAHKTWHGVKLHQPDWTQQSRSLAFSAEVPEENVSFHFIFNAYWGPLDFELPETRFAGHPWRRWIDTALESPHDIQDWPATPALAGRTYRAEQRSIVVLIATRFHTHSSPEADSKRSDLPVGLA